VDLRMKKGMLFLLKLYFTGTTNINERMSFMPVLVDICPNHSLYLVLSISKKVSVVESSQTFPFYQREQKSKENPEKKKLSNTKFHFPNWKSFKFLWFKISLLTIIHEVKQKKPFCIEKCQIKANKFSYQFRLCRSKWFHIISTCTFHVRVAKVVWIRCP